MLAKELAEILLQHPDLEVVVTGYEDNLNPLACIIVTQIKSDPSNQKSDIYGKYNYLGQGRAFDDNSAIAKPAIYLGDADCIGTCISSIQGDHVVGGIE